MVFKFIQLSHYTLTLACHRKQISIIAHIVLLLQLRSQTKMLSLYICLCAHLYERSCIYRCALLFIWFKNEKEAFTWFKFYSLMNIITTESELFIEFHVAKTFLW